MKINTAESEAVLVEAETATAAGPGIVEIAG